MARVWGSVAPVRLVVVLLLTAVCSLESFAAPWRAPGAGGWAERGPKVSSTGGQKSGCIPVVPEHGSLGPAFHGGPMVMGSTSGARKEPVAALLPRAGSSRCRAVTWPLAGWSTAFILGVVVGGKFRGCVLGKV